MKEYASVEAMNADIDNIEEGEVVKVVAVSEGEPIFYLKELGESHIEYQPVDLSQYQEGDTISLKGMKLNNTITWNGMGSGEHFRIDNSSDVKILRIIFQSRIGQKLYTISILGTIYTYEPFGSNSYILSDSDVEAINSENIWQDDASLIVARNQNTMSNFLLEPVEVQSAVMKKLIKEEDAPVSPSEYEQDLILADDILNNGPEIMDELNDIMDTQYVYTGLGGTEDEIVEVLDDILGMSVSNENEQQEEIIEL